MAKPTWIPGDHIGKGSFGTVTLGFERSTARVFAVKSVIDSFESSFHNEIQILRSMNSPFVVEYYGDEWISGKRNLYMEYVSGGTAAEFVKSGGDEEDLRRYVWCLVSAVEYVHKRGVVHCDVKGRNVLIDRSSRTAKLADFGSAREVGDRTENRGSPLWMAPEVVRGESQGPEADVWALGCTVIEMVTGSPPWKDEGVQTLSRIGYSDELPEFPARLSADGVDFVEKCLRRDPRMRWSCEELLQHPFLQLKSEVQIVDLSPRSVFQMPELESSDDDEQEEAVAGEDSSSEVSGRIGNLAGVSGANWESDGWVEVRCVGFNDDEEAGVNEELYSSPEAGGGDVELTAAATAVESGVFTLTAVKTREELFLLGLLVVLILCRIHHCCGVKRNIPFFMCYIFFHKSTIMLAKIKAYFFSQFGVQ